MFRGWMGTLCASGANSSSYEHPQTSNQDLALNVKLKKNEIIIPIEGESMLPVYEEGGIAIGKPLEIDEITARMMATKEVFAIGTRYSGTILKYIRNITDDEIIFSSENSVHKDIFLHRSEIEAIFIITGDITYRRR